MAMFDLQIQLMSLNALPSSGMGRMGWEGAVRTLLRQTPDTDKED